MNRFKDKVVLVTGSSQGIGRAIAVRFAQEGAKLIVNGRQHDEEVDETLKQIGEVGAPVKFIGADIGITSEINKLWDESLKAFGTVDILINNAGLQKHSPFLEVKEEDYDLVMGVNLKGMFFLTQAYAKYIKASEKVGIIVNNSSVHEELPFPNFASYCASKGGMQMVMRTLAVELAPYNIRINNVAPGAIKTPINAKVLEQPKLISILKENISLGRLGEPEDVAGIVAFLASDDAKYVTGSTYYVDGGLTFHYKEQ